MKNLTLFAILFTAFTLGLLHAQEEEIIYESGFEQFKVEVVIENLELPWGMVFLPENKVLITERNPGGILLIDLITKSKTRLEGVPEVYTDADAGMKEIKLHPNYQNNGWIYFSYSKGDNKFF